MRRATVISVLVALAGAAGAEEPAPPISSAGPSAEAALAQRARVLALDEACGLLSDAQRAALLAAQLSARNSLLRAGWTERELGRLTRTAENGQGEADCDSAETARTAARVMEGFEGWRRLGAMSFPGDHRTWSARRPSVDRGWALLQNVSGGAGERAWFGLAVEDDGAPVPALALDPLSRPAMVRVRVRNRELAPTMVGSELRRLAAGDGGLDPLAAAAPPEVYTDVVWASGRAAYASGDWYADGLGGDVVLFRFPPSLIDAIARLDPRETFSIEVQGDPRQRAPEAVYYVEVGDFAPAYYFVAATRPAFPALEIMAATATLPGPG